MLLNTRFHFRLADGKTLFAEALTTNGILASRLCCRLSDAKRRFEAAHNRRKMLGPARSGAALLTMLEEIGDQLELCERIQTHVEVQGLLSDNSTIRIRESAAKSRFRYHS
jgi:hypothetical protein